MSKALNALVIGGSIGGLSTAHALLRAGGRVTVLERAPQVSGNSLGAVSIIFLTYTLHEANLCSPAERSGMPDACPVDFSCDKVFGCDKLFTRKWLICILLAITSIPRLQACTKLCISACHAPNYM